MEPLALPLDDDDAAEKADTVAIELNFRAFADNVPTSQHAKRAPSSCDPSIQDFADQALELAALRAELKRLTHDYEVLQKQSAVREARFEVLRRELTEARTQLRNAQRDAQRQHVQEDVRAEETTVALDAPPAIPHLVPVDQVGSPVALTGEIVTIGRARNSDICIQSRGVSRDHARLLIAPGRVTLVDVSATNGCFVNDVLVKRHRLRDGDRVRIGDRSFRFAQSLSPASASAGSPSSYPGDSAL